MSALWSAERYLAHLHARGELSERALVPEQNVAVWRAYLPLYAELAGPPERLEVLATAAGPGFYRDPLNETGAWEWALLGPISHARLPWTAAQVIRAAEELAERGAGRVRTDTFGLAAPPSPEEARAFLWLNSPRARLPGDFDAYVASLSHDRRKELRAQLRRFDALPALSLEISARPPDADEVAFLTRQSRQRWGDDAPYALVQWAWPMAVARALPEAVRFARARWSGALVLMAAYVLRGEEAICQATCRQDLEEAPGLGGFIDAHFIRTLCAEGAPVRVLDPTVRTGLEDTPGIWVSKRRWVNEDHAWPTLIVDPEEPAVPELPGPVPRLDPIRGWVRPAEPARIGRPL